LTPKSEKAPINEAVGVWRGLGKCQTTEQAGTPISASRVRKLLEADNFDEISALVPETTLKYLKKYRKKQCQ
jgi:citrate lyase synthetase